MLEDEMKNAVIWALTQFAIDRDYGIKYPITKDTPIELVDSVREYFNNNNIEYNVFSYNDLIPYLN